jgi:hypothetical protein
MNHAEIAATIGLLAEMYPRTFSPTSGGGAHSSSPSIATSWLG